jgi:hypothetical protein
LFVFVVLFIFFLGCLNQQSTNMAAAVVSPHHVVVFPRMTREEFLREREHQQLHRAACASFSWAGLPPPLWLHVLSLLSLVDLRQLSQTSRSFYHLVQAECARRSSLSLTTRLPPRTCRTIFELPVDHLLASGHWYDPAQTTIGRPATAPADVLHLLLDTGLQIEVPRLPGLRLPAEQPLRAFRELFQESVLLLNQGGYLAIARYSGARCLKHTSIHRYVVRKKAGGRQVTRDKAGSGHRCSIGAQIRRDQEGHFRMELRKLLLEWQATGLLDPSVTLFLAAPGPINRAYLFFEDSPLLHLPHCFHFPFTTNKPNWTELQRCFAKLTAIRLRLPAPSVSSSPAPS